MRGLLYTLSVLAVIGLAYWAYEEGYETRQTEREVAQLQRDLGRLHEELSVLKAEWAYLNRPRRLRILAEMNFERLGLMALTPAHFGTVTQVAYPAVAPDNDLGLPGLDIALSVDTVGQIEHLRGELPSDEPKPVIIEPAPRSDVEEQLP